MAVMALPVCITASYGTVARSAVAVALPLTYHR